jgi:hypothetical protein
MDDRLHRWSCQRTMGRLAATALRTTAGRVMGAGTKSRLGWPKQRRIGGSGEAQTLVGLRGDSGSCCRCLLRGPVLRGQGSRPNAVTGSRFAIPADWKLTLETVRPERLMCISTNPCPSLHRTWGTGKELTEDDITAVFSEVGFGMKAVGPCKRRSNDIGDTPICISRGTDEEFDYFFTVFSPAPGEPSARS